MPPASAAAEVRSVSKPKIIVRRGPNIVRAQGSGLNFDVDTTTQINTSIYRLRYEDIVWPRFIPRATGWEPWAPSVTYFSEGIVGEPAFFAGDVDTPMPTSGITRDKHGVQVLLGGIGYNWGMEEEAQLSRGMLPINIVTEKARAARYRALKFIQDTFFDKDTEGSRGEWDSLFKADARLPAGHVIQVPVGTGGSRSWAVKNGTEILKDISDAVDKIIDTTNDMYTPDTIALPPTALSKLRTKDHNPNSGTRTIYEHIQANSPTGRPFRFLSTYRLKNASQAGAGRAVIYRRSAQVLRAHLPMNHRFLGQYRESWNRTLVPGIFRVAGVEIMIPSAMVYLDDII